MKRSALVILLTMVALIAGSSFGAPIPSKSFQNQSVADRDADLAIVRGFVANEQVARVLAERGLDQQQVTQKIAQLSTQDLHQLAQNLNQLQVGGARWAWVMWVAAVILLILMAQSLSPSHL